MPDLVGSIGTGSGRTSVTLRSSGAVNVFAQWMGDDAPLDVTFRCVVVERSSHYEALEITGAVDAKGAEIPLPPCPDALILECIRVPLQELEDAFAAIIWLHPQSYYDPGDQLPVEDYDIAPALFQSAAKALAYLETPWKLAPDEG